MIWVFASTLAVCCGMQVLIASMPVQPTLAVVIGKFIVSTVGVVGIVYMSYRFGQWQAK